MKSPSWILPLFAACAFSVAAATSTPGHAAQQPTQAAESAQQPPTPPATAPDSTAPAQTVPAQSAPAAPEETAPQTPASPAQTPAGQPGTPAQSAPTQAPATEPGHTPAAQPGHATAPPAATAGQPATPRAEDTKPGRRGKVPVELPPPPSAYNGHPKLVVVLVIDQFRADYLERYRADFKGKGFKLFLEKGAYFPDCYYDYANTKTAPGHATIGTGSYTDGHGISSNEWWDLERSKDHPITSVEDERYSLVGLPANSKAVAGSSPRNLRASTVGDELRLATQGRSRVFGVSLKDRASILPSGYAANAAFWIDQKSGTFVTSTYYLPQLPEWATTFNASGEAQTKLQEASAETGATQGSFYDIVGSTPIANAYELDFAKALITGEQLGMHDTTDMLTLSLSANDIVGHTWGPDSIQEHDMVDALDTDLDGFFTWLDKTVPGGLGNVWVAFSADHGVAPTPSQAAALGMPSATLDVKKVIANLNDTINQKFSPGEKVTYLLGHPDLPYLALNRPAFERAGINELEAETAVYNALEGSVAALTRPSNDKGPAQARLAPVPTIFRAYTRLQLEDGQLPPTEFGRILGHSYSANGGWYVMLIPAAFQMGMQGSETGTTHYSPYSYDRHVPLGFFGAPFAPGTYHGRVGPVDLASTLAAELGINQPSAAVGQILTQALKSPAAITYPRPPVVRTRPAAHKRPARPTEKKPQ